MAWKDPYEELLGYHFCQKCSKRSSKPGKCCKEEFQWQDGSLLCYFEGTERSGFAEHLIQREMARLPLLRTVLVHEFTCACGPGAITLEILHRPGIDLVILRRWLNEYVHRRT